MKTLGVVQHDSHSCGTANHGVAGKPFPKPRAGVEHVGAVYVFDENGKETVRLIDLDLLKQSRGAADCLPGNFPSASRVSISSGEARVAAAQVVAVGGFREAVEGGGGGVSVSRLRGWLLGVVTKCGLCSTGPTPSWTGSQ